MRETTAERIGLVMPVAGGELPRPVQLELIQHAERLGYDSVWLGEIWGQDLLVALGWLAAHTSRIKLATGIANVFSRTPGAIAQAIATIDDLSDGRAILGLGASGQIVIENWHGVPFDRAPQRLKEYAEIVRLALSGRRVNYKGEIFKLRGFQLELTPPRRQVPIYFASISAAGFRMTGRYADGWLPVWITPGALPGLLQQIGAAATETGRSLNDIDVAAYLPAVASSDPAHLHPVRAVLAHYIGGMGVYYHRMVSGQGFAAEADAIKAAYSRDKNGAAALVTDAMLERFAITGSPEECRRKLAAFREAGIQLPILTINAGIPLNILLDTLEALAPRRGE